MYEKGTSRADLQTFKICEFYPLLRRKSNSNFRLELLLEFCEKKNLESMSR